MIGEAIHDVPDIDGASVVGRGGFAVVYRAIDLQAGRPVAVKLLSLDLDEGDLRYFERERDAMARLSTHPNVVTLHRTGVTGGGTPYLVMEFAPGGSLWDRLRTDGPMPWNEAVAWLVPICEAVEHAHQQGIRHRDIKPQNILISAHDRPLLSDFGIAGLAAGSETITRKANLSLSYASPEQIEGRELHDSTDVYSLGATLHTLISGAPPFSGGGPGLLNAAKRILEESPPDLDPSVPVDVRNAVAAALAKDPADRPTIDRFRAALEGGTAIQPPRFPDAVPAAAPVAGNPSPEPTTEFRDRATAQLPPEAMASAAMAETGEPAQRPGVEIDAGFGARRWMALAVVALLVAAGLATGVLAARTGDDGRDNGETAAADPAGGAASSEDSSDGDGDGATDEVDNCPDVANPDQEDGDGDARGDACDPDDDDDGVLDEVDNCPAESNADQEDVDGDRLGDACDDFPDRDRDGIIDTEDSCITEPEAPDTDGDGVPDACDATPRGMLVTAVSAEIVGVSVIGGDPDDPANLFGELTINDRRFRLPEIPDSNDVRPGNWVSEPVAVDLNSPLVRVQVRVQDDVGFCVFCDDDRVDLSPDPDSDRLSLVIDVRTGAVDLATESWNRLNTVGTLTGPDDGSLSGTVRLQGDDDGDLQAAIDLTLTLVREPVQ